MAEVTRLPPPDDLRAAIAQSQSIGVMLYQNDLVSARGTDVMVANVRAPKEMGIAGYLTFRECDENGRPLPSWLVTFFSGGEAPHERCRVRVPTQSGETPEFAAIDPPTPVSDDTQRMIRARRAALVAIEPHVQPQNPVILPAQAIGKDGILVYLLAATTRKDVAVLGKHHRVLVAADGETVISVDPLTKSVLEIPLEPLPDEAAGEESPLPYVTHLVTEWPLETHVFVSLLHRRPIYVGTSRGEWVVDGAQISLLSLPASPDPPPSASRSDGSRKPWWQFW